MTTQLLIGNGSGANFDRFSQRPYRQKDIDDTAIKRLGCPFQTLQGDGPMDLTVLQLGDARLFHADALGELGQVVAYQKRFAYRAYPAARRTHGFLGERAKLGKPAIKLLVGAHHKNKKYLILYANVNKKYLICF